MEVAVRKKLRRIFTIMGTTALIFTITACGNRMDAMQPDSSYVADFFDIPDSVTGIERLLLKDDMAYMCCLEEDGTSYLAAMNIDDGKFLKQNLELDASVSLLDFGFAPDNSIWAVCLEQAGVYSLRKFDNSGSLVQSVDLAGVMDTSVISAVGRDLFLSIDREGNICVAAKGRNTLVYLFDNNGSFLFSLDYEGNLMTTTTTAGGQIGICATSPDRMNYDLLTVDMKSLDWSKDKIYLGATACLYGGVNKDFYRFDSSVLYGYAAGAQEGSPVFNWSDILNEYIKPIIHDGLNVQGLENLNAYLYGDEMAALQNYAPVGLPYCAGYACGYHLVKHYLNKTGKSIAEATILPASEVLNCVEDFWNKQNIIWSFTTSMRIPLAVLNLFSGRLFLFIN